VARRSTSPVPYALLSLAALLLAGAGAAILRADLPGPRGQPDGVTDKAGLALLVAVACLATAYPPAIVGPGDHRGRRLLLLALVLVANGAALLLAFNTAAAAAVHGFYFPAPEWQALARRQWGLVGLVLVATGVANGLLTALLGWRAWKRGYG
jgi:hypothetical protein